MVVFMKVLLRRILIEICLPGLGTKISFDARSAQNATRTRMRMRFIHSKSILPGAGAAAPLCNAVCVLATATTSHV